MGLQLEQASRSQYAQHPIYEEVLLHGLLKNEFDLASNVAQLLTLTNSAILPVVQLSYHVPVFRLTFVVVPVGLFVFHNPMLKSRVAAIAVFVARRYKPGLVHVTVLYVA
jgi:hypothetical protein